MRACLNTIRQLFSFNLVNLFFLSCRWTLFIFNRLKCILSFRCLIFPVQLLFQLFLLRLRIQIWVSCGSLVICITFLETLCNLFNTKPPIVVIISSAIRSTLFLILDNLPTMTDRNFDTSILNQACRFGTLSRNLLWKPTRALDSIDSLSAHLRVDLLLCSYLVEIGD